MTTDAPPQVASVSERRTRVGSLWLLWSATLALLVGLALRQEHPSVQEPTVAAVVLLGALVATWILVPRPTLARAARWAVPAIVLVVTVGLWNPWNLYAVTLLLDHPFVGGFAVAMFALAWVWPENDARHLRLRQSAMVVVVCLAMGCVAAGSLWVAVHLLFGRTGYLTSTSAGGDVRIDHHTSGDCNDGTDAVVRSDSGLLLREGPISPYCSGNTWTMVNEHLLVIACNDYSADQINLEAYLALDPATLSTIGETRPSECPRP